MTPRVGEWWRVTIEGEVTEVGERTGNVYMGGIGGWFKPGYGTWERLPDPEPDWQVGDLVLDADGAAWRRRVDGWWLMGAFGLRPDDKPTRPLRRLVPEVQA